MNKNWTSKEEYLQFVRDWKQVYKDLSQAIREQKFAQRASASLRAGSNRFHVTVEQLEAARTRRSAVLGKIKEATGISFWDASALATELLEIRKEEKVRAGIARQANLQTPA